MVEEATSGTFQNSSKPSSLMMDLLYVDWLQGYIIWTGDGCKAKSENSVRLFYQKSDKLSLKFKTVDLDARSIAVPLENIVS